jgi:hypothetical protein
LTQALADLLFGVSASDPVTYLGISLLLVLVALAAELYPGAEKRSGQTRSWPCGTT